MVVRLPQEASAVSACCGWAGAVLPGTPLAPSGRGSGRVGCRTLAAAAAVALAMASCAPRRFSSALYLARDAAAALASASRFRKLASALTWNSAERRILKMSTYRVRS
jgi:hypothetical protein